LIATEDTGKHGKFVLDSAYYFKVTVAK